MTVRVVGQAEGSSCWVEGEVVVVGRGEVARGSRGEVVEGGKGKWQGKGKARLEGCLSLESPAS